MRSICRCFKHAEEDIPNALVFPVLIIAAYLLCVAVLLDKIDVAA